MTSFAKPPHSVSTLPHRTRSIRHLQATVATLNVDIARWRARGLQVPPAGLPHVASTLSRLERQRDDAEHELRLAERTAAQR